MKMDILRFDIANPQGKFRILNATNGGPWHKRHAQDQWRTNLEDYKAARFRYTRNHDSAMCGVYGGPYSHDISCIFPNFDLDPYDPASYDFACTDEAILVALDAETETFFRLGQTIEHHIKKHATLPPKDFKKWAVICEHIIRHYNEGWADGIGKSGTNLIWMFTVTTNAHGAALPNSFLIFMRLLQSILNHVFRI